LHKNIHEQKLLQAVAANHGARGERDRITLHVVRIKTASCLPYTFLARRTI